MLGGMLNWKWYLGISIVSTAIFYLIGLVDTGFIKQSMLQLRGAAIGAGMSGGIADVIVQPVIAIFDNDLPGALLAGFLWPFSLLWMLFTAVLFFYSVLGSGFGQAADTIRDN
jgi:hypothetical protein